MANIMQRTNSNAFVSYSIDTRSEFGILLLKWFKLDWSWLLGAKLTKKVAWVMVWCWIHDRSFIIRTNVDQDLWRYMASIGHAYTIDHIMVWLGNVLYNVFQHQPETCLLVTLSLWHMVDLWIDFQWKQIIDARGQCLPCCVGLGIMTGKRFPNYYPFVWGINCDRCIPLAKEQ